MQTKLQYILYIYKPCAFPSSTYSTINSILIRARLEGFLRRCVRLGFRLASSLTLASVCDEADDRLFTCINHDSRHLLRPHLPLSRDDHYNLRKRQHNLQLPTKTSTLSDNGFIKRMLYKNTGCNHSNSFIHSITINFHSPMLVELHRYLFTFNMCLTAVCLFLLKFHLLTNLFKSRNLLGGG